MTKRAMTGEPEADWVWTPDVVPAPKLQRVLFRMDLTLSRPATHACITLSARTLYRLVVNGTILASGPARSYPEFREADTHDLRHLLRAGENRIEVEVLHHAPASFHHLSEAPGFIAWGYIDETGGARHSLSTPGSWLCRRRTGVNEEAPPLSFAQHAIEAADLCADLEDPDLGWKTPILAPTGNSPFLPPRTIPPLTRFPQSAATIRVAAVDETETIVGAWVSAEPAPASPDIPDNPMAAAKTWIFSPCAQTVRLASWWGDYWVNGTLLAKNTDPSKPLRQSMNVPLVTGWNRLCANGPLVFGYWEFCLAWPTDAGLSLHSTQEREAPGCVDLTGPVPGTTLDSCRDALVRGVPCPTLTWRTQILSNRTCPPLRKLAWTTPTHSSLSSPLPLELPPRQTSLISADMGGITLGPIILDIDAPAGTVVDIGHGEQTAPSGRPDYSKSVTLYGADHFVLAGGRHRLETFAPRGLRHFELLISHHTAPVTLHDAGVMETRYPYAFTGSFECSDNSFNRLWAYGRRTLELCSEDVLTDCPWRERTLYGGDLLASMGATVSMTHDLRLVRRSIEVFLQSFNPETDWLQSMAPIPRRNVPLAEYPLLVAISTGWYLRLTNDVAFAQRAWPIFRAMARAAERMRRADGLYAPPWPAFIDHHRKVCSGPTAPFNAALVAALRAFAQTAHCVGDSSTATELELRAHDLESKLVPSYFDHATGWFRDLPLHDSGHTTEGSPAFVWPLLFAPATRDVSSLALPALRQVLSKFAPDRESQSISPYQMFYLLALLRELGEAELAEDTIRRIYASMLEHPTGTLWEHSQPNQSLTHAWSCGINDYFASAILGVRLGFEHAGEAAGIRVHPCAASLEWARGRVPHPLGAVSVEWHRTPDGHLSIAVDAPPGVPVEIAPAGPLAKLIRR